MKLALPQPNNSVVLGQATAGNLLAYQPGLDSSRSPAWRWPLRQLIRRPWLVVPAMVLMVYVSTYYLLPGRVSGVLLAQVLVPGMWLTVAAVTYFLARREGAGHLRFAKQYLWIALLVGSFQVAAQVVAGMFVGFGNSPYASTINGMLSNLAYISCMLLGMEFSRSYLVSVLNRRGLAIGILVLIVVYAFIMIPPARLGVLGETDDTMRFVGRFMVPNLSESLLTTFLAFLGGPIAAIGYRGAMMAFEWFSPILPDLPWTTYFILGTFPPLLGFLSIQSAYLSIQKAVEDPTPGASDESGGIYRAAVAVATGSLALLLLAVILLNLGFLGFKSMVVISGSMSPTYNVGDVVITSDVAIGDLAVGEVVKYRRRGIDIVHRVVGVDRVNGQVILTTKGDANNATDSPGPNQQEIQGRVVAVVPKIGWLTIWLGQPLGG